MGQSSTFQIFLIIGFVALIGLGVVIFALGGLGSEGGGVTGSLRPVEIWGTYPQTTMANAIQRFRGLRKDMPILLYREFDPRTYDQALTEALATGGGPDLFFLDEDTIIQHSQKITTVSFDTFPERSFKDRYIEGAEYFLFSPVSYAIPFGVDPLILYWNRDLVSAANFTAPPSHWDQVYDYIKAITKRSPDGLDINRATIALGDYQNIDHATEVLSTLFFQSGSKVIKQGSGQKLMPDLSGETKTRSENALRFYTEFSNPTSAAYTWNRALPSSRDAFLGNTLALYIGYASEYRFIREANPNLNFDVAMMPQPRDIIRPVTYGKITGLAISRMSDNKQAAFSVMLALSDPEPNAVFTEALGLVTIRRDLLGQTQSDPWKSVAFRSALNARTWYRPTEYYTNSVFQTMIEGVVSGKLPISKALQNASGDIGAYLP